MDRFSENSYQLEVGSFPTSFDISVKNVSFAYDDRGPVLKYVSFFVPGGQFWG